jgi:salicylate hydroxylase
MNRITVVGAGIGGMTAGVALAQAGFVVTLLEAAPAFGDIGAGVTLSPNAMKGLDHIGVCESVARAGIEPTRQRIQHWQDGRTLVPIERASAREKYGAPYVTIHRADLHAILVVAARQAGVKLMTDAAVVATEGTTATLHDGRRITADAIIGADGLKSIVRRRFETVAAHFTGHVAWRGLAPVDAGLADLIDPPGIHIGPGKMVTRYPVRDGTLLNMVFFARQGGWTEDGWQIPGTVDDLLTTFAGWGDEVQRMIAAAGQGPLFKWAINAQAALPDWSIEDNVALLGDAAHAMTPFLGHGAACAIEDAVVLARALAASGPIADGLSRYVAARKDRASFIQAESNANADRLQGNESALFGLSEMRDEESLGLFDYDARTATI